MSRSICPPQWSSSSDITGTYVHMGEENPQQAAAPLPQPALERGQTRRVQGLFGPQRPAGALLSSSLVERGGLLNSGQQQFGRRGEARCSSSHPEPASSQPGTGAKAHLSLASETGEIKSFPTLQGRTDVQVKPPSQGHLQDTGSKPCEAFCPRAGGQCRARKPGLWGAVVGDHLSWGGSATSFVGSSIWGHTARLLQLLLSLEGPGNSFKFHYGKTNIRRVSSPPSKISDMWFSRWVRASIPVAISQGGGLSKRGPGGGAAESREFLPEVCLFPRTAQCCLGILQIDPRFQSQHHAQTGGHSSWGQYARHHY